MGMDAVRRRVVNFWAGAATIVGLACALSSCDWLNEIDDRLKSCHDCEVRLVNDEQTIAPVHIIGPKEGVRTDTLLQSGQSRGLVLCLDLGHGYNFRVESEDGRELAAVKCPASRSSYDGITPSVVWTPIGLRCIDW
jgi:hypothetical protein